MVAVDDDPGGINDAESAIAPRVILQGYQRLQSFSGQARVHGIGIRDAQVECGYGNLPPIKAMG